MEFTQRKLEVELQMIWELTFKYYVKLDRHDYANYDYIECIKILSMTSLKNFCITYGMLK